MDLVNLKEGTVGSIEKYNNRPGLLVQDLVSYKQLEEDDNQITV